MNYKPVVARNQSNGNAGTKACDDEGDDEKKIYEEPGKEGGDSSKDIECSDKEKEDNVNNTNNVNVASINEVNVVGAKTSIELPDDPNMPEFEDIVYSDDDEDVVVEADMNNLDTFMSLQALVDGKKIVVTEASVRRDLQLDDEEGTDCLPNATIFEELTRMGYEKLSQNLTFYKAFLSPQWKFLIHTILQCLSAKTTAWNEFSSTMASGMSSHKRIYVAPSHTKKIFANMRRQGKDFSRRETPLFPTMVVQAQEEMGEGSEIPTDPHHTPIITQPSSSQPQRKQKSRRTKRKDTEVPQPSDSINVADEAVNEEPSMQLKELMDFCTKLQQRVLDLENTKTAQAQEITSLKLRVKKLEKKGGSRTYKLRRLYKVGRSSRVVSSDEASLGDQEDASKQGRKIHDIDADEDITLENVHDAEIAVGKVNTASIATIVSAAIITEDEITLTQPSESTTTRTTIPSKDKGKGIMVEEPLQMKKKDQISFHEQEAIRLQAEFDEEVRLAREKDEANVAFIEEWNDIQAKIETDYDLAQRMQAEEQEELTIDEKATLFQQLLEKRKQKRRGIDHQPELNKEVLSFKRVNTFVDFRTKLVEGTKMEESSKKAEVMEESSKKAKIA
ncbi:hypothetical protein Tco_1357947 [Tanacetum coccineum]